MADGGVLKRTLVGALVVGWVVSGLLTVIHALGIFSTPGISALTPTCPPRETGLRSLCAPANVRVVLPTQVPQQSGFDGEELSGPVEVTLAFQDADRDQRFAYNVAPGLLWLSVWAFISVLLHAYRPRSRSGGSTGPRRDRTFVATVIAAGSVLAVGGSATILAQRWAVQYLAASTAGDYVAARVLPLGLVAVPLLLGGALAAVAMLNRTVAQQREELAGLV